MKPAALRERREALRAAGEVLRRRPADETLDALGRVLDAWRNPDSTWRKELAEALPEGAKALIKNIAPDIPLSDIIWGTLPFVILMAVAILILCLVPGIAMWLPDLLLTTTR